MRNAKLLDQKKKNKKLFCKLDWTVPECQTLNPYKCLKHYVLVDIENSHGDSVVSTHPG